MSQRKQLRRLKADSTRAALKLQSLYDQYCEAAFDDEEDSDLAMKILCLEWVRWCERNQPKTSYPLDKYALYNLIHRQESSNTVQANGLAKESIGMIERKRNTKI